MKAFEQSRWRDFETSLAREVEARWPALNGPAQARAMLQFAPHFGLAAEEDIARCLYLICEHLAGFQQRPPLPVAPLRILYRKGPPPVEKLRELREVLTKSKGEAA